MRRFSLPLPFGERAGVKGQSCLEGKSGVLLIEAWGKPWPLTPALSLEGRGSRHDVQPIVPSIGLDADAKRLRGMRPARNAARPASIASFIACAISTGSFAPA